MRFWQYSTLAWLLCLLAGAICRHMLEPKSEDYLRQVRRSLAARRYDDAEHTLRRLLVRHPARTDVRLALSELARNRGEWSTVAAVLKPITDADPTAADTRLAEGDAWVRLNRAARAEDCWSRALRIRPEFQLARHRLLFLYGMQLRREEWLKLLWELYDRDQVGMREMIQLMIAGHIVWETGEAIETVQAFAAANPEDAASRRAVGIYLLRSGQVSDGVRELSELWKRDSTDVEAWLALVECYLASADRGRLRELFADPPNAAQDKTRFWRHRGSFALLERRYADAAADFERALRQQPYDGELRHKMAQALRFLGETASSERHAHVAVVLAKIERLCHSLNTTDSPSIDDLRQLVQYCEELRMIEEARGWTTVGLSLDPADSFLMAARDRLAGLPPTSARHSPSWEELP